MIRMRKRRIGALLTQLFATKPIVQRRTNSRWYLMRSLLSSYLLMIVLCSMMSNALYEVGGSEHISPFHQTSSHSAVSSATSASPDEDTDRLVWEYIVKKYSSSGDGFTPEELFTLATSMQKCQGGGNAAKVDLKQTFPINSSSSKRGQDASQVSNCSRIMESIIFKEGNKLSSSIFYDKSSFGGICQRLLFYIENPDCCIDSNDRLHSPSFPNKLIESTSSGGGEPGIPMSTNVDPRTILKKEKPSSGEVWGYGFLLVTIISCSSLVGVSLMPFMAKDFYKHLLTVMIGLAVGSLTGSALFHLLPQALRLSEHDPDHGYLHISLVIVGGIWLFFMVERVLKFIMDYKERKGRNWKMEKMSNVLTSTPESSGIAVMTENGNLMKGPLMGDSNGEQRNSLIFSSTPRDTGVIYECQEQVIKASFGHQEKPRLSSSHDHHVKFEQGKDSVIATVAWMIIFGDGLHNFIDGLSIGAAFNESIWTGVSISVAVLCEELPHELGDFAVLLNAGMSMRQAVTYNFLSACTCYIGMAVGILLGEIQASSYIFALAGGMFLYISLVDMVPEMNEIAQETSKVSLKKGLITLALQNLGLFTGITTLYLLALYQDSIQF